MKYLKEKLETLKETEKMGKEIDENYSQIKEKHRPSAFTTCLEEFKDEVTPEQLAYLKSMDFSFAKEKLYEIFPWMNELKLTEDDEQLAIGLWFGCEGWRNPSEKIWELPFATYQWRKKWEELVEKRARQEYDPAINECNCEKLRAGFDLVYHVARAMSGMDEASFEEVEKQFIFYESGLPVRTGEFSIRRNKEDDSEDVVQFFHGKSTDELVYFMMCKIPNVANQIVRDDKLYGDLRKFVIPIYKGEEVAAAVNVWREGSLGKTYDSKNKEKYESPVEFIESLRDEATS